MKKVVRRFLESTAEEFFNPKPTAPVPKFRPRDRKKGNKYV